jgi:hypothetical protein
MGAVTIEVLRVVIQIVSFADPIFLVAATITVVAVAGGIATTVPINKQTTIKLRVVRYQNVIVSRKQLLKL